MSKYIFFITPIIFLIFLSLFSLTLSKEIKPKINAMNTVNITIIKEKLKKYEKEYIDLYIKSSKNIELFCNKIKNNIKSLDKIKNKFANLEDDITKGLINDDKIKEFLDIKADISFSIHNIDIIVTKLKIKEKSCIKDDEEFINIKNDINAKSQKNKENIINNINNILKRNHDL